MGFFKQESRSGLPLPSPGGVSDPGTKPVSPVLAVFAAWVSFRLAVSSRGWDHLGHLEAWLLAHPGQAWETPSAGGGWGWKSLGSLGHLSFCPWSLWPGGFWVAGLTCSLRAPEVSFLRLKQVKLDYLSCLVSEVTQHHCCHIAPSEIVPEAT